MSRNSASHHTPSHRPPDATPLTPDTSAASSDSRDPLGVLAGMAVVLIFVTVVGDVTLRTFTGAGILGVDTIVSDWWMVAVALLGIAVAQRDGGQLAVDLVDEGASPRLRRWIDIGSATVTAAVATLLGIFGAMEAVAQTRAGEYAAVGEIPIWPARFLIPVGFFGLAIAATARAARTWRREEPTR